MAMIGGDQEIGGQRHGFPGHHEQIGVVGQQHHHHGGEEHVVLQADQPDVAAAARLEVAGRSTARRPCWPRPAAAERRPTAGPAADGRADRAGRAAAPASAASRTARRTRPRRAPRRRARRAERRSGRAPRGSPSTPARARPPPSRSRHRKHHRQPLEAGCAESVMARDASASLAAVGNRENPLSGSRRNTGPARLTSGTFLLTWREPPSS